MSVHTRPERGLRRLIAVFAVFVSLAVGVAAIGGAAAGAVGTTAAAAATDDRTLIAKTPAGKAFSKVVGSTATGDAVSGSFTPIKFVKRDGKLWVKGFLDGVITNDAGKKTLFSGIEKMRVKKINGKSATSARALNQPACDILTLTLGPLDLDLLGLQIHLDRVVLTIVAQPGPGNLLGNLLCAIAGLLDPGGNLGGLLSGLLTQIRNLLNQILGALNLGV